MENTKRDAFILEKADKGFSPTEIQVLLKREGFAPVSRARIYQIFEREGLSPRKLPYAKNKARLQPSKTK